VIVNRSAHRLALMLVIVGTIGCDRVTKQLASNTLAGRPTQSFLGDTIRLRYLENTGAFLSLGARLSPGTRTALFTVATGLMLAGLALVAFRRRRDGWIALGLTLFVSGGLSNWIDRAVRGSVVDFLNVGIGPVRTGVFNVADMAIMFGAAIFMIGEVRKSDRSG
jgi:signal peptidase II